MIVCVGANPSIDKLFVVDRVVHGAIHRPIDFVQVPGGKAFNVARSICALGGTAKALGIAEATRDDGSRLRSRPKVWLGTSSGPSRRRVRHSRLRIVRRGV